MQLEKQESLVLLKYLQYRPFYRNFMHNLTHTLSRFPLLIPRNQRNFDCQENSTDDMACTGIFLIENRGICCTPRNEYYRYKIANVFIHPQNSDYKYVYFFLSMEVKTVRFLHCNTLLYACTNVLFGLCCFELCFVIQWKPIPLVGR